MVLACSAPIDSPYIVGCPCAAATEENPTATAIPTRIREKCRFMVRRIIFTRPMSAHAILCSLTDRPGMLSALTKVLADHQANITYVDIHPGKPTVGIYFEFTLPDDGSAAVLADLRAVAGVESVSETPSFAKIYGKRIIVMGGGAQVGQVAMGAITEADRHNIRGERISVDTIPLVGEEALAGAVRSVVRLPRVRLLVLAGSIMGGEKIGRTSCRERV